MRRSVTASCWIAACLVLPSMIPRADFLSPRVVETPDCVEPADLLPDTTLVMIELGDVRGRWDEIRGLPAVAHFQDRVSGALELQSDSLPLLLGDRSVVALIADPTLSEVAPLAVLRPAEIDEARRTLERLVRLSPVPLAVEWRGDVVSIVPAAFANFIGSPSSQRSSARRERMRTELVDAHLPDGGLVRGWFDPNLIARVVESRTGEPESFPTQLVAELVVAELEAMQFAGFRRDLTSSGVVTEAVFGFAGETLPQEVRAVFRPPRSPRSLPATASEGTLAIAAFGAEAGSLLPWLRHASERFPRGALRNLDFWIEELERRTGIDVGDDLFSLLGERAWLAVLSGDDGDGPQVALVVEAPETERLEPNLLAVHDWVAGQVAARTLGFARPRIEALPGSGGTEHLVSVATPFGKLEGPRFVLEDGHLILASGELALRAGRNLRAAIDSPGTPGDESPAAAGPNESLRVDGRELARGVARQAWAGRDGLEGELVLALTGLLSDLDEIAIDAWFEDEVVRLRGRVDFR
jgi:hypothetical protein